MLKQQLQDDIKTAMLAGDALRTETLRGLKSAILYAEVAGKKRDDGLRDDEIEALLARESKKRAESAELYVKGEAHEKAEKELAEKRIIDHYLPEQISEEELEGIVGEVIFEQQASGLQAMGKVIAAVKLKVGNSADGALIAKLVKERLA